MPAILRQHLGQVDYLQTWSKMRDYAKNRGPEDADQIWILEHPPVYTHGTASLEEHVFNPGNIPIVRTDRGGQVTYHGPGQLILYLLLDLKRLGIGPKALVGALETACITTLNQNGLKAYGDEDARGVYVEGKKIASIGLRITRGCCYHGLALNVDMDLAPFSGIHPCGYKDLQVTQLTDFDIQCDIWPVGDQLADGVAAIIEGR